MRIEYKNEIVYINLGRLFANARPQRVKNCNHILKEDITSGVILHLFCFYYVISENKGGCVFYFSFDTDCTFKPVVVIMEYFSNVFKNSSVACHINGMQNNYRDNR